MPPRPLLLAMALLAVACASPRPSELPRDEPWLVVVKSARLPSASPWITRFAHHTWIDVKRGSEADWWRAEVQGRGAGVVFEAIDSVLARNDCWYERRGLRVLAVHAGAAARAIAEQLPAACIALDAEYAASYLKWPGPNSNTFVADLARAIPQLRYLPDGNAVGKDWSGWFGAGATTSGTGLHLDTPVAGAALGLREGVELHLLGFTTAVRLFPPALALPFLPEIPGGWCDELRDAMPLPPPHYERRLELPAAIGAGGPAEVEAIWEADGWSELLLVDAASGGWLTLQWQFDGTRIGAGAGAGDDDGVRSTSFAIVHELDGDRHESFLTDLRHDRESAFELPFGCALARVHQQRLDAGRARLRVTIARAGSS